MTKPDTDTKKPSLELLRGELDPPKANEHEAAEGPVETRGVIFPGSPVTALGIEGPLCHYLDRNNQIRTLKKHGLDEIRLLFGGRVDLLTAEYPRMSKGTDVTPPVVIGWKQDEAAAAMVRACFDKGIWKAANRVRGLGAWLDDEGGVVLHCGREILYKGGWHAPGEIDGFVYPLDAPTPHPLDKLEATDKMAAHELLATLNSWQWSRGDIDAYLLLGWLCSAMFGGALKWRPMVWMSGGAGTGKSELQKLIGLIFGKNNLLQPAGATEAAIRQYTGQSTIPVAIDELEPDASSGHVKNVIKLARLASSGGKVIKGGQDHKATEFMVRNSFLFSSVLISSMLDQDISRIAVLKLLALPDGAKPPDLTPAKWERLGQALRRMVLDNWGRYQATFDAYSAALASAGHNHRGRDQFGTLLTLADLVLYDSVPDEARLGNWAKKLSHRMVQDQSEQQTDWQTCLRYLFDQEVKAFRGGNTLTVGTWIGIAAGMDESEDIDKATKLLSSIGLRVLGRKETAQILVANRNDGLSKLFQGSSWFSPDGGSGVWAQSIERIPNATKTGPKRFNMMPSRCTKFPLASIPGLFGEKDLPEAPPPSAQPPDLQDFE